MNLKNTGQQNILRKVEQGLVIRRTKLTGQPATWDSNGVNYDKVRAEKLEAEYQKNNSTIRMEFGR